MEREGVSNGVADWAVNQLGLDDVFQAIVRDSNKNRSSLINDV